MLEKRKHVRIDMINPSEVRMYDDDVLVKEGNGRTLNISRGGVLLETPFPIEKGQNLALVITLEKEFVYISGSVVHTRCENEHCHKTGVAFASIDDRGLILLDKYIKLFMRDQLKTGV
jgi:c-di-GMP-binding flagellar brake protein YcgR